MKPILFALLTISLAKAHAAPLRWSVQGAPRARVAAELAALPPARLARLATLVESGQPVRLELTGGGEAIVGHPEGPQPPPPKPEPAPQPQPVPPLPPVDKPGETTVISFVNGEVIQLELL